MKKRETNSCERLQMCVEKARGGGDQITLLLSSPQTPVCFGRHGNKCSRNPDGGDLLLSATHHHNPLTTALFKDIHVKHCSALNKLK